MAELYSNRSLDRGLSVVEGKSGWLNAEEVSWQESGSAGFWIKPLFEDASRNLKTWLMKIEPGAYSPLHDHAGLEQVYVLEGSFFDQDRTYRAGEYILRAPGVMHTAGSEDGALVILFYSLFA